MVPAERIDLGAGWHGTIRPADASWWDWELISPHGRETAGTTMTRRGARWQIRRAFKRFKGAYEREAFNGANR